MRRFQPPKLFLFDKDGEITPKVVQSFIAKHQGQQARYKYLRRMYLGQHEILDNKKKESHKPDNRLVANFAKYAVDTFNSYFIGNAVNITHEDEEINTRVEDFIKANDNDDNTYELTKLACIYGHSFFFLYQDEESNTRITYNSPLDMFVVHDDTIAQKVLFGVRYGEDSEGKMKGVLYTKESEIPFVETGDGLLFGEVHSHFYGHVPIVEYVHNEERMSIFEPVMTLIHHFNKTLSEKANDVDYFADAYLAIIGAKLDEESTKAIRRDRLINLFGENSEKVRVEFLEKPNADETQEHLLDRMERLIYQLSMVTNLTSEELGNASGVGMAFKLQEMENMALSAERKLQSTFHRVFQMFFALPTNVPTTQSEEWFHLAYRFTRNIPHNIKEESETAKNLEGIVPKEEQLKVLSLVDNPHQTARVMEEMSVMTFE